MNAMVKRFQRSRWSSTRIRIEKMKPGKRRHFPLTDYYNCHSSVTRLNDAYAGRRKWKMVMSSDGIIVTRIS